MNAITRHISRLASISAWIAGVLPNVWAILLTSAIATAVAAYTAGLRWIESPRFQAIVLLFLACLWSIVSLVWLSREKIKERNLLRYGITIEGINFIFNPQATDAALQLGVSIRNYTQTPLRFTIEDYNVQLESRTLQKYKKNSLSGLLPRGALRTPQNHPFKLDHIKEFYGRRTEGTMYVAICYGDADRPHTRRLNMTFEIFVELNESSPTGFAYNILEEFDGAI